jgi:5-methylcytosine-specific restriction endonuclease McrA
MPDKLPYPCAFPRCSQYATKDGLCDFHRKERDRRDREQRGSSCRQGYGRRHERWRKMVLARCPACAMCGQMATVADHIVPLKQGGNWTLENGQGLCASCHAKKTRAEEFTQFLAELCVPKRLEYCVVIYKTWKMGITH